MDSFSAALKKLSVHFLTFANAWKKCGWHGLVMSFWLALCASSAWAQTPVGGAIAADTVWRANQSPILVGSDIQIQPGVTLTIEPGTTVYMAAATRLIVSGTLKASGTVAAPILFTSDKLRNNQSPLAGDWQQIIFNAGSSASALQHVQVAYGKGVMVNGAAPSFNYVTIKDNQGAAMAIDLASSPLGVGNKALNNSINAIVVPEGDIGSDVTWGLRGIPYLVLAGKVSVGASPKITSMTPNSVQQGETQSVTVAGARLAGLTNLKFSLSGVSAQVLSATDSQAQLQLSAANEAALGVSSFSALTNAGEVSFNNALTVTASQPKLTSVTPAAIYAHQGSASVTLKGVNLAANSVAYLDATALQTTFVSATELTAIVENQITLGQKTVTLRTPKPNQAGEYFTSNGVGLNVIVAAPVATSMTPNALRRGETKRMQIAGTNLAGTELSTSGSGLSISNPVLSTNSASFDLTASASASLGVKQIKVSNTAGDSTVNVTVNGALPVAVVAPTPLAVPPDNVSRQFAVQLSFADTENHTFAVSVTDPTVATATSANVTIVAGQIQAVGGVTGIKNGTTTLRLVSPTMGTLLVPLYVTPDFLGMNTARTPLIGVVLASAPVAPTPSSLMAASAPVGIMFGNAITDIAPKSVVIGTGPLNLTVTGSGLGNVTSVAFVPAEGITAGTLSPAADGKSLTLPVTIAADAVTGPRRMVLTGVDNQTFAASTAGADRLLVTLPVPEVQSITPMIVTPATGSTTMVIRGKRLHGAQAVSVTPSTGIVFGSSYTINPEGTELSVGMAIAADIAPGQRIVKVATAAGSSASVATTGNTMNVVAQVAGEVTPFMSSTVGVVLQSNTPPPQVPRDTWSKPVGVTFGAAAVSMSPRAKVVGNTFSMQITGTGLGSVTSANFVPATGIVVGTPVVAADGRSLTMEVAIAADAPKTERTLNLMAGSVQIPFASRTAALFNVTGVVPSIDSVTPLSLVTGAEAVAMTIRGLNFADVQSVSFVPAAGMTAFTPTVVSQNELVVNVQAGSSATPGKRAVVVTTLAGSTSSDMTIANTVTVAPLALETGFTTSRLVGVMLQSTSATPPPVMIDTFAAPLVGVVVAGGAGSSSTVPVYSAPVGVTLGPVAYAIAPKNWSVGSSGTLTVNGTALEGTTALSVLPADGITIGAIAVAADGQSVSAPVTVAADAPLNNRRIALSTGAVDVPFGAAAGATFGVFAAGQPSMSSIDPIMSPKGSSFTMTILGSGFKAVTAVVAEPANGVQFDSQPTINSAGTEITVRVVVAPNATLGKRVIRLQTATGASSAVAAPANSFNVYAP